MTKKLLRAMVCIMLCMGMLGSNAMAVDAAMKLNEENQDNQKYVSQSAMVGDVLYLLVSSQNSFELYSWQEGMDSLDHLADNLFYAAYYAGVEEVQAALKARQEETGRTLDEKHVISSMFAYDGQLMGLNGYTGHIFTMKAENGSMVYEDGAVMKDVMPLYHRDEEYAHLMDAVDLAVVGDKLLYLVSDYTSDGYQLMRLVEIGLKDGSVAQGAVEHVQRMCAMGDGRVMLICRDDMNAWDEENNRLKPYDLKIYDPATGAVEEAGKLETDYVAGLAWWEAQNALVMFENCRVMAQPVGGEKKQVAYMPLQYVNRMHMVDDTAIAVNSDELHMRTLSMDYRDDRSLTVYGSYMDQGTMEFTRQYPQVAVYSANEYYEGVEKLSQAMVAGENALDVLQMGVSYSSFTTLMEKGYCADLSGEKELAAMVDRMYPPFRDAVMKDGKLYAIPVGAHSYDGWYVANGVMEEMGLTMEDIPTNLVELCAFATRWNEEWVEEYPQFQLLEYTENYKQAMLDHMVRGYLNYCTAKGEQVKFTSPEFKEMMAALDAMRVDALEKGGVTRTEDEVGYRQGLLMYGYPVVGNFEQESEYRQFVPMTLTEGTDFVTGVNLEVVFINPRTKNMDMAVELIKCRLEAMHERVSHTLCQDETDGVPNENYDKLMESEQRYYEGLKKKLNEAEEAEKKEIQALIENQEKWMEKSRESLKWTISPKAQAWYMENIAPAMFVQEPNFLSGGVYDAPELRTLMERYLQGQMKMEQFIREMDNK